VPVAAVSNEEDSDLKRLAEMKSYLEKKISEAPNNWSGLIDLWGVRSLAVQAVNDFQKIPIDETKQGKPRVLLTGEIFIRLDEFSNNHIIRELEGLNVKVKLAPFREWLNYTTWQRLKPLYERDQL
jgi:predicted nucleotide-binding protein (sugar kinase/HSP70/actin superfamily)